MTQRRTNAISLLGATLCVAVLALPLAGCGSRAADSGSVTASDTPGAQAAPGPAIADPAKREACFGNERAVETQVSVWIAQNPGTQPATSVQAMMDAGVLHSVPTCPSDGIYSYDAGNGQLNCSVHGHF